MSEIDLLAEKTLIVNLMYEWKSIHKFHSALNEMVFLTIEGGMHIKNQQPAGVTIVDVLFLITFQ